MYKTGTLSGRNKHLYTLKRPCLHTSEYIAAINIPNASHTYMRVENSLGHLVDVNMWDIKAPATHRPHNRVQKVLFMKHYARNRDQKKHIPARFFSNPYDWDSIVCRKRITDVRAQENTRKHTKTNENACSGRGQDKQTKLACVCKKMHTTNHTLHQMHGPSISYVNST